MDSPYWHSKDKGCEIFPDKKSWSHIVLRYSRHYCKTHNVTLGHQAEKGASQYAWALHFYSGKPSLPPNYEIIQAATRKAAQAKKAKKLMRS